jgi:hypothetical protein
MVAEAPAAGGAGVSGKADDALPAGGRSRRAQSRTPAPTAACTNKETSPGVGGPLVRVSPTAPLARGSLHDGWAVAVLSDVLKSTEDKAMGALQAFQAFEAHEIAAQASEQLGLERVALVARFVVAAQDLALVGLIKLGSKASRGMLHKLAL